MAALLVIAGIISGFTTYGVMTSTSPLSGGNGEDTDLVIWLLNLDLVIMLLLVTIIARRLAGLWTGRKHGIAGSRLHVRLVFIFSLLAVTPAIIMTVFAAFFMHFGVQSWFNESVKTAVNGSQAVAEAYLEEHKQVIKADILGMANDMNRQAGILVANKEAMQQVIRTQSFLRNFSEAVILNHDGRILARTGLGFSVIFKDLPTYALARADSGDVVVMTGNDVDDRVRALVKLNNFVDAYLFVGRMVDPVVLSHLYATREAVQKYQKLEGQSSGLQVTFTMIFVVVALILLLAAIWIGLVFARQMVLPIGALINAADRVRAGDLTTRVREFNRKDEFDTLGYAFNRMTRQIEEQRDALVTANRQLDQRRRFTETVLAGVSSGVVGLDKRDHVTLTNSAASKLFQTDMVELSGKDIGHVMPELKPILVQAHQKPDKVTQAEIPFSRKDGSKRILLVRIAIELIGDEEKGAVLTFDDITELQSAQRKAAWAGVARRIAHEIKNPLTPIQLSAERLKRKYLGQIKEDAEVFSQCTDTIVHHVEDIGRMVNEFSAFSRMPEPVMQYENLVRHVQETAVFQQQAHTDIDIRLTGLLAANKDESLETTFDPQQIRQALTNIIQNAVDSVKSGKKRGRIDITMARIPDEDLAIIVSDNGAGLPQNEDINKLTEPYITHKEKGTGLGLAIVSKIMEDHKGKLVLDRPPWLGDIDGWENLGGATVILNVPVDNQREETQIKRGDVEASL